MYEAKNFCTSDKHHRYYKHTKFHQNPRGDPKFLVDLTWNDPNRTLNFLKRNLSCCSSNIKATAYLTIVRPSMEYAAVIWDPYHHSNIQQLEKVQHRAARWVLNDFNRFSSVTAMLQHLSWPSLQLRRKISRLQALFKIIHQDYSLSIPPHFISMTRSTRLYHPHRFILPNSSTY